MVTELRRAPGPLSQQPLPYGPEAIPALVEKLRKYDLTKGELLTIANLRPAAASELIVCIDEIELRFTVDQQYEILDIIGQVLGRFPPEPDADAVPSVEANPAAP